MKPAKLRRPRDGPKMQQAPGRGLVRATKRTAGELLSVDNSMILLFHGPVKTFPHAAPTHTPHAADLCALLAKARRLYGAAVRSGDWAGAARHRAIYESLFERRRRILLAQGARLVRGAR